MPAIVVIVLEAYKYLVCEGSLHSSSVRRQVSILKTYSKQYPDIPMLIHVSGTYATGLMMGIDVDKCLVLIHV